MARVSSKYVCSSCGFQTPTWYGRCPQCQEWNSMVEEVEKSRYETSKDRKNLDARAEAIALVKIKEDSNQRFSSGMAELDRVLGGGIVPGSVILLGGEPGIGKSTLLLTASRNIAKNVGPVLYTSGEESGNQVKLRANRINVDSERLMFAATSDVDTILQLSEEIRPNLLVVDSIQTCEDTSINSMPGAPTQVRATATKIQQHAKALGIAVVMVGHTVKTGGIAGPRLLEHLVDTVLYFEGDSNHLYRIIRAQKNRFGATNEVAVFQMEDRGIVEVSNPSEIFLSERDAHNIGSAVGACLKGNRPMCVEVQALVATSTYGAPRCVTSEIDYQRAIMILAVLSKRLGTGLENRDAFVKIAGGIRVDEPGVDLPCAIALASSYYEVPVRPNTVCFGEIGLSGDIRMVARMEERVREALRIGFTNIIVPKAFEKTWRGPEKIKGVSSIEEAVRSALMIKEA
jgi:DNA repair protein RadA/Sms